MGNILRKASFLSTLVLALALNLNAQTSKSYKDPSANTPKSFLYAGNDRFGIKPIFELGLGVQISTPISKVSGVPENIRLVPIHDDDDYAITSNNGPIKDEPLKIGQLVNCWTGGIGANVKLGKLELETAIKFINGTSSIGKASDEDAVANRRNYTNQPGTSERGVGAALTYYTVSYDFVHVKKSVEASVPLAINKNKDNYSNIFNHPRLVFGLSQETLNVQAETGWDRYNNFEKNDSFHLGKINIKGIYSGISFQMPLHKQTLGSIRLIAGHNSYSVKQIKYPETKIFLGKDQWFISGSAVLRF